MVTLKVLKKFQDKDNKEKIYQVGETLSTSDLDRVNNLVSRGICSISAIKEANKEEKKPEISNDFPLKMPKVQRRRPPPAAEAGRSCWGSGQQDASAAQGTKRMLGAATR